MESEMIETVVREYKLLEENSSAVGSDLPPEYCHYRDEGYELAGSCLNCPFPQCVYDEPGGRQALAQHFSAEKRCSSPSVSIIRITDTEGKSLFIRQVASEPLSLPFFICRPGILP